MTVRVRKNEARQGERRFDQERILLWSILVAVVTLGGVTLAAVLALPSGG